MAATVKTAPATPLPRSAGTPARFRRPDATPDEAPAEMRTKSDEEAGNRGAQRRRRRYDRVNSVGKEEEAANERVE